MNNLFPITFSIPEEKIVSDIPNKTFILANYIPVGVGERTYIYDHEIDYYNGYKNSLFAITKKKGGWDCMRHYEILACGCIPYFENLEKCPEKRLFNFPKDIILKTNKLFDSLMKKYNINKNNMIGQMSQDELNECKKYIQILLEYTRSHLTTKTLGHYIIENTNLSSDSNILYICNPADADYLRCLTLHGLKQIFEKKCEEYPFLPYIYKNCNENMHIDFKRLHGRGFTYTRLLDRDQYYNEYSHEEIINNIKNKKYDIIIYSSLHKEKSNQHQHILIDVVKQNYPPNKIAFLCGEDEHLPHHLTPVCLYPEYTRNGHICFVREI
jgi:hypothetical protein